MKEYNTAHNAASNAVHNAVRNAVHNKELNKELNKDPVRQARKAVLRNVGLFNSTVLNRSSRSKGLGAFDPFSQFDVDSLGRARQSRKASAKNQKHNIRLNNDSARQRKKSTFCQLNRAGAPEASMGTPKTRAAETGWVPTRVERRSRGSREEAF